VGVVTAESSLSLGVDGGVSSSSLVEVFGSAFFVCCSISYISNAIWQRACQSSHVSIVFDASSCCLPPTLVPACCRPELTQFLLLGRERVVLSSFSGSLMSSLESTSSLGRLLLSLFLCMACQWFLIWLGVMPGSSLAISDHLFPYCFCADTMTSQSDSDILRFEMSGSTWLIQRSLHCLGSLPWKWDATSLQLRCPYFCTS